MIISKMTAMLVVIFSAFLIFTMDTISIPLATKEPGEINDSYSGTINYSISEKQLVKSSELEPLARSGRQKRGET